MIEETTITPVDPQPVVTFNGMALNKQAVDALYLGDIQADKAENRKDAKWCRNYAIYTGILTASLFTTSIALGEKSQTYTDMTAGVMATCAVAGILKRHEFLSTAKDLDLVEYVKTGDEKNVVYDSTFKHAVAAGIKLG